MNDSEGLLRRPSLGEGEVKGLDRVQSEIEETFGEGVDRKARRMGKVVEMGGSVEVWSDEYVEGEARRAEGEEGTSVGEREDKEEQLERKTYEVRALYRGGRWPGDVVHSGEQIE
jgi:hypothetical protein